MSAGEDGPPESMLWPSSLGCFDGGIVYVCRTPFLLFAPELCSSYQVVVQSRVGMENTSPDAAQRRANRERRYDSLEWTSASYKS